MLDHQCAMAACILDGFAPFHTTCFLSTKLSINMPEYSTQCPVSLCSIDHLWAILLVGCVNDFLLNMCEVSSHLHALDFQSDTDTLF